ncbi:hypothetical protein ACWGSB_27415 [Streptomyces albidoflavus]|uniref:hypothetical protein n=1 Tax=Streptomyces sp. NRRL F-6628 TaxID=1463876 RepID=UPI00131D9E35|nr:hypothetical protein [Streptomyces sp. NRRL F-6628]
MSGFSGHEAGPYEALRRGRAAVDRLASRLAVNGGTLREVTATQVLLAEASPRVCFQEFTSAEEAKAGADWMWWWVDRGGTCFGLLAQAKILKVSGRRWTVDFGYTTKGHPQSQIAKLIEAAEPYSVPAAYILYCGDRKYRATLECSRTHGGVPCRDRERVGVSVACALAVQEAAKFHQSAAVVEVFHDAVPLEDIASPVEGLDEPIRSLARELDEELARFLRQPQRGARRVAKELLRPLERIRLGQFASAATLERAAPAAGALFRDVADQGHFSVPYLDHVLRGLRTGVPDYVRDVMDGRTPPAAVTDRFGGIVVITDADALG